MNKIIMALGALLIVLIGGIAIANIKVESENFYNDAEKIAASDVFSQEGRGIFYFYQDDCSHCQAMKPSMKNFFEAINETDVNFYIIDMADETNSDFWYQGEDYTTDENFTQEPKEIKSINDMQIVGTPTMVTIDDGEVTNYGIGGTAIFDILDKYINEFDLDVELDRSSY